MILGKKKRKRMFALLMSLIMIMSLAGCSAGENNTQISDNSTSKTDNVAEADTTVKTDSAELESNPEESDVSEKATTSEIPGESVSSSEEENKQNEETGDIENSEDVVTEESSEETSPVVSEANDNEESSETYEEKKDDGLTPTMRNSINMLNYMTALTQRINVEKGNQLYLESAYNSFENLYPNAVDYKTEAQISSLMDTIQSYRMISVKRARLQYIYEQNRAQALRQAIPNPIGLLSAVQSRSVLKVIASVLYMAADSAISYQAATSQADLEFIKEGWELDDEEANELHESTKNALTYMFDMVRDYDIPGDYALNKSAVSNFVLWSGKPDSQLERKISWLETNQGTYLQFSPYWLELAKDYYNYEDYSKCLEAVKRYEAISTRIFRKDIDYATVLPMAIIAAKETMGKEDYIKCASEYCSIIRKNTGDKDWSLRYFVAQIYMDLYSLTKEDSYMDEAYKIARENVNVLVDEQKELNNAYLADIKELKASKDATKREKAEVKQYNKFIKNERKIAVPPVSESLYLNADLLFALAKERNIDANEQKKIEAILHENGESIFLTKVLDDRFWFTKTPESIDSNTIEVSFDSDSFSIPASYVTDRSTILVTISGANGTTTLDDWTVTKVDRPKGSKDCSEFLVTYKSKLGDKYKFSDGEIVTITVTPVEEAAEEHMDFIYKVNASKKPIGLSNTKFERVTK